jgi:hypothetical protein
MRRVSLQKTPGLGGAPQKGIQQLTLEQLANVRALVLIQHCSFGHHHAPIIDASKCGVMIIMGRYLLVYSK